MRSSEARYVRSGTRASAADTLRSRREVLAGAVSTLGIALLGCTPAAAPSGPSHGKERAEPSPTEGLMREHGVIERVMLVYDECARRIESNLEVPPEVLPAATHLVRAFVHDYHEKTEEELFPRCEESLLHPDLVRVLRDQHAVGEE